MSRLTDFLAIIILLNSGCARKVQDAELRVIGGKNTNDHPAVVNFGSKGSCTGTFLSKTTMLTAAHCLVAGAVYEGVSATKVIRHKSYQETTSSKLPSVDQMAVDLAIFVFNKSVAPATAKFTKQSGKKGTEVTMVGFGCNQADVTSNGFENKQGAGQKRAANITITISDGKVLAADEQKASGCPGDSGGPIFNQSGEQIGVASTAGKNSTLWVDLGSASSQTFLADAVKLGADIPGISAGSGSTAFLVTESTATNTKPPVQPDPQTSQNTSPDSGTPNPGNTGTANNQNLVCPPGMVLYTDGWCRASSSQSESTVGTSNQENLTCPSGMILYTDGWCRAPSGQNQGESGSNTYVLNGSYYTCPGGYYLGVDGQCHLR